MKLIIYLYRNIVNIFLYQNFLLIDYFISNKKIHIIIILKLYKKLVMIY